MSKSAVLAIVLIVLGFGRTAVAQPVGWGGWLEHQTRDGITVSYRIKIKHDELRVQWKCSSQTGQAKSCSVGAGQSKTYICTRGSYGNIVGRTKALGERASVKPYHDYIFPDEPACRGLNADYMNDPLVEISIEDD